MDDAQPMKRAMRSGESRTVVLLFAILALGALREPRLLSAQSIESILLWIPLLTVMAVGQMFVILTKGIDVSVGSILGLAGILIGMLFRSHPDLNVYLGAALGMMIGSALGFINGFLVAWVKIPPIITTLGTLSVFRGIVFFVSHGEQVDSNAIPPSLTHWALDGPVRVGGLLIPWLVLFALAFAALAAVFLGKTVRGRYFLAVGGNSEAAEQRGLPVQNTVALAYVLSGLCAGLAGVFYAARYGFVNPGTAGRGLELTVIAAAVIGGCDINGGRGTVVGVLLGCVLLGVINVALAVLGIEADWQLLVYGAVILLALIADASFSARAAAQSEAA